MKLRYIVLAWTLSLLILVVSFYAIKTNLISTVGITIDSDQRDALAYLGLKLFQIIFSISVSLAFTNIIWKLIQHIKKPQKTLHLLIYEFLQSYFILLFFELLIGIIHTFIIAITEGYYIPTGLQIDTEILFKLIWLDFFLVCIFYTFIGFQSARKNRINENNLSLLDRLIYDFLQLFILSFCFLVGFSPLLYREIYLPTFTVNTFYFTFILIVIIETFTWLSILKRNKKISEFNYRLRSLIIPGVLLIVTIPRPLFLVNAGNFTPYLILITIWVIFSYLFSYFALKPTKKSPKIARVIKKQINTIFYLYESSIASRGAVFNYPEPIDIISSPKKTELIKPRYKKVKLKFVCGKCFHVFETEAYRKDGKMRPVACPFCRSLATTPVWE